MSAKHTPGPWTIDPEGETAWTIESASGTPLCDVYIERDSNNSPTPECEANARLIAAAPEMLVALQNAGNVLAALATGQLKGITADSSALALIRDAIAKATGNQ